MAYNRWLCHHGVKGMKWGVRKREYVLGDRYKVMSTLTQKERDRYEGTYLDDSEYTGRNALKREREETKMLKKWAKNFDKRYPDPKSYKTSKYHTPFSQTLVDKKGDPMGFVLAQNVRDWDTRQHYINVAIAVTKKYQGKRVSERLVNEGKKWFDAHPEYMEMRWYATKDNVRSQKLAEKTGFTRAKQYDEHNDYAYVYKRKDRSGGT